MEEGANVNLADRYGDTPLHGALRHYTMTTIKQLHATNQNVAKVPVTLPVAVVLITFIR